MVDTSFLILTSLISFVGLIVYIKILHSFFKSRVEFTGLVASSLFLCISTIIANWLRLSFDIEISYFLNITLYFVAFIATSLAEILGIVLFYGFKNLGENRRIKSINDKITFYGFVTGIILINIFNFFGYKENTITPDFIIIEPSSLVKIVIVIIIAGFAVSTFLDRKKLRHKKVNINLGFPLRVVIIGLILIYISTLLTSVFATIIGLFVCYLLILFGYILICYIMIRFSDFYDRFSSHFDLRKIFIIHSGGICLAENTFTEYKYAIIDEQIITSLITAVMTLTKKIVNTTKKIRRIELDEIEILFYEGKKIIGVLITRKSNKYLKKCLKRTVDLFEEYYKVELEQWKGELYNFFDANTVFIKSFGITI